MDIEGAKESSHVYGHFDLQCEGFLFLDFKQSKLSVSRESSCFRGISASVGLATVQEKL